MEKMPANLLKKNSTTDTQLQTFVDKQPKKQFFCELLLSKPPFV